MTWKDEIVARLAKANVWGYRNSETNFSEPAAFTALSLIGFEQLGAAKRIADWLVQRQQQDGTVGVSQTELEPQWPTALAISVWANLQRELETDEYAPNIKLAIDWAARTVGDTTERSSGLGHDTTLKGWPWALGTHAWLEPTSLFVIAFHQCGKGFHPRAAEGLRVLVDRQLPRGGYNYGNTLVLGQELLGHIQPTGIALSAMAWGNVTQGRIQKSLDYLTSEWPHIAGTASTCFAAIGLAGYDQSPDSLDERLEECWKRFQRRPDGIYKLALIGLALQKSRCPLLPVKEHTT